MNQNVFGQALRRVIWGALWCGVSTLVWAQALDPRNPYPTQPNQFIGQGQGAAFQGQAHQGGVMPGQVGQLPMSGARPNLRADTTGQFNAATQNPGALGANMPPGSVPSLAPLLPNEFQKFLLTSTGRNLPLFGLEFFQNAQLASASGNPFAPVQNSPVTADYPLGPGDEVLIRGWGSIEVDVRTVIDRNGLITIPRVGSVPLAGVRAAQAEGVIRAAIAKNFKDFELNVTLGQLRSITVYVVGQARRPGTYQLSSVSSLVSGLFASGGPNAEGSMRRVQLRRGNQVVTEFDLYAFLSKGDKGQDVKLLDGDVIVIPPALGHVALSGQVTNPAVYELKAETESLEDILQLTGGLPVVADPRRAYLERLEPGASQPRRVEEFALDAAGLKKTLKRGDVLTVLGLVPEFSNAVTLRGNVTEPVRMPWRQGMRIRDLIPSKEVLMSRRSVDRQNATALNPRSESAALIGQGRDGVLNRSGLERANAAGPLLPDESAPLASRIGNLVDEINLDYAVVERVDRGSLSVKLLPFNLGRVLANAQDPDNLPLQVGDIVTVFSADDVRVPLAKRRIYATIEGEVQRPGVYQMAHGETLQTLIDKAGGFTQEAYLFGTAFYREEVRRNQAANLQRLLSRMEAESSGQLNALSQSQGAAADAKAAEVKLQAAAMSQRQALERLRQLSPTGRISLDIPAQTGNVLAYVPALRLQNGDRLSVSSRPDYVYVLGSVNTESALIYRPGKTVADYLEQSGLATGADRDGVILLRADGSAMSNSSSWGNAVMRSAVMPGDTIVLPERLDRETAWSAVIRNTKDLTQIFYQLGIGAAGLKVLRQ